MVNSGLSIAGWHVAEKLGIPAVAAYLWPATPTRYMPGATGQIPPPWIPFKGLFNYLSTKLSNQLFFRLLSPLVNRCRDQVLGLRPLTLRDYWFLDSPASPAPLVYGFSSAVVHKPADWGPNQQIAGYWFLDADEAIGQVVHDESVRRQASRLGRQIRDEDGVARAIALIDAFAHRGYF